MTAFRDQLEAALRDWYSQPEVGPVEVLADRLIESGVVADSAEFELICRAAASRDAWRDRAERAEAAVAAALALADEVAACESQYQWIAAHLRAALALAGDTDPQGAT